MKTKNFYTVVELSNMFYISKTNVDKCNEAHKKFPNDETVLNLLHQAYKRANEVDSLLIKLNAVDIVLDYYEGINRTTGNNKLYL